MPAGATANWVVSFLHLSMKTCDNCIRVNIIEFRKCTSITWRSLKIVKCLQLNSQSIFYSLAITITLVLDRATVPSGSMH